MVLAQHYCLASSKRHSKDVAPCRKKECNKYDLTTALSVSDWLIIMIGPGGLLSAYFAVPVSVFWVELQKSK
jgi:hypothetical protein